MGLDLVQPNKYIIVLRLHTQKTKHHCLLATFEAWRACFKKESMVSQDCLWTLPFHLRQNTLTLHSLEVSLDSHALRVCWNSMLKWRTLHTNGATTMSDTHTGCITGAPLALIKHKFKQKIINHFKMVIVEHSAKHGPFRVTHSWTWLIDSCS